MDTFTYNIKVIEIKKWENLISAYRAYIHTYTNTSLLLSGHVHHPAILSLHHHPDQQYAYTIYLQILVTKKISNKQ